MKPDVFARPVQILIGLGFPMEIRTAGEAYRHLIEWPHLNKDASYTLALNACRAAPEGRWRSRPLAVYMLLLPRNMTSWYPRVNLSSQTDDGVTASPIYDEVRICWMHFYR